MNKILIDTNIYSHAMRGNNEVIAYLQHVTEIGISSISIGELLSGFKARNKAQINRQELNIFLDSPRVTLYYVDEITAEFYSATLNPRKNRAYPFQQMISGLLLQRSNKVYL